MTNQNPYILIAEDDDFYRNLMQTKLKHEGLNTYIAKNGKELLAQLEKKTPDLVLLDLIMPDMDGFETLEKIRNNEKTKNTKVIILSNLSQTEDIERVKKLGIEDYIVKSNISIQELVKKVKTVLNVS